MSLTLDIKSVASPALLKRGCVNVIGLESVREQTGARWEKLRDSIYSRLETLLSNKLASTDFFTRLGESAYLVVTPSSDGDDSRLVCLKIAYELHRSLLGTCSVEDLSLSRVMADNANMLQLCGLEKPEILELAMRGGVEELYRDLAAPSVAYSPFVTLAEAAPPDPPPIFCFAPVWDAPREAMTAYRLEVQFPSSAWRQQISAGPGTFKKTLKTFLAGLAHATRIVTVGLQTGGRYLMVIPVSHDVLSVPSGRAEIAGACRNLASELRPFLVFEIADLPPGVPQSRMSELVCSIRPFCRAVTIDLPHGQIDHITYSNVGHQGISLVLSSSIMPPGIGEEIAKLGAVAKRLGLSSMVTGIRSVELADIARRAGVNYLCGPFIGREVDIPQPMCRLSWAELSYRHGPKSLLRVC